MKLAKEVSTWSKDISTKCGSVIVNNDKRIISTGFNGYPKGVDDDNYMDRDLKLAQIIHGELNAILFAKRCLNDCTIYVYPMPPCSQCMGAIIQSGITRVVTKKMTPEQEERWGSSMEISYRMANNVGLRIVTLKEI